MAPRRTTKTKAAEPDFEPRSQAARAALEAEKDYTVYLDKDATDLQTRLADWILDKTEYQPADTDTFYDAVRLATALRMEFQASPENQKVLADRRAAKEEEAAAAEEAPPKRRGRPAKAKVVEEEPEAEEDVEEAPKPRARRTRTATATATKTAKAPARRTGTRKAKPAADVEDDDAAPY